MGKDLGNFEALHNTSLCTSLDFLVSNFCTYVGHREPVRFPRLHVHPVNITFQVGILIKLEREREREREGGMQLEI